MADEAKSGKMPISPAVRKRLQKCFEHGNRLMNQGEHDYANEMFTQCLLGDPGNMIYIQTFLGNLRLKYENNKKGSKMAFLKGAGNKAALKKSEIRKKWDDVMKQAAEMLKLNPWDSNALVSMSNAVGELGYTDAELAYLKLALENNPNHPDINRRAGEILADRNEFDQAIACFNRVLKAKPDDREVQRMISNLSVERTIKKGRYEEQEVSKSKLDTPTEAADSGVPEPSPEEKLEKRIRKNPDDKFAYLDLADIHSQSDNLKKAEEIYQWGLKSLPEDSDLKDRLLDIQRRRLRKKVNEIKQQYEQDPKPELKEKFFAKKKELEEKTLQWNAYRVELSPQNPHYHYEYGVSLQAAGQYKEAIAEFQQAKRDTTRQGESLLALGQCFQQIKQYPLAMKHYQQAVEQLTDQQLEYKKKAYYLGAKLALGLKKYDLAEELASQLAEIDFSYKDVSDLLDKIAQRSQN